MIQSKSHLRWLNSRGQAPTFIGRAYAGYKDAGLPSQVVPENPCQSITANRGLDLVLCFQSDETDLTGWRSFIGDQIRTYQSQLKYLQITEEANVNMPSLDGYYHNSRRALVEGVLFAGGNSRFLSVPRLCWPGLLPGCVPAIASQ